MRNIEQFGAQQAREIGIPGVGVDHVDLADRIRHRHIGADHPHGSVGAFGEGLGMGRGAFPRLAHALNLDTVGEATQLGHQLSDMDAGATIDVWGVLAGQDGYT